MCQPTPSPNSDPRWGVIYTGVLSIVLGMVWSALSWTFQSGGGFAIVGNGLLPAVNNYWYFIIADTIGVLGGLWPGGILLCIGGCYKRVTDFKTGMCFIIVGQVFVCIGLGFGIASTAAFYSYILVTLLVLHFGVSIFLDVIGIYAITRLSKTIENELAQITMITNMLQGQGQGSGQYNQPGTGDYYGQDPNMANYNPNGGSQALTLGDSYIIEEV